MNDGITSDLQQIGGKVRKYIICSDGACSGNPGPGGWAFEIWSKSVHDGNLICSESGSADATTNNIMELRAVENAIRKLIEQNLKPGRVLLHLDSKYVLNGIFDWMDNWKGNGWKNASKKPVKNAEIWKQIDNLITGAEAKGWLFIPDWVKGHSGDVGNMRVDKMAANCRDIAGSNVNPKDDLEPVLIFDEPKEDFLNLL
ncbi:MAG: ribonuclease HI [Roseovarius sp.]|nr:ribonuclease HI [Roseovarius sp.]MCY4292610.1 ribonuclease HI [Roseovarius sp.]